MLEEAKGKTFPVVADCALQSGRKHGWISRLLWITVTSKRTQHLSHTLLLKLDVSFPGVLFSLVVVMYVIWVQAMADLENYTNMKKVDCPDFAVYVRYGWSFMLAPIGVFFALLAGMLFLLVGRAIYLNSD